MKLMHLIFTSQLLFSALLASPCIRIANKTKHPVYVSFYYSQRPTLVRASTSILLPASNAVRLSPPHTKFAHQRFIACAPRSPLPRKLSSRKTPFLTAPRAIGLGKPSDFTLFKEGARYRLEPTHVWETIERTHVDISHSSHIQEPVRVEQKELSIEEKHTQRMLHAQSHIEKLLPHKPARPLTVAFCSSGGGIRAMSATMGALRGLKDIDFLDTITTMSVLSGSSWALAPWILSGQTCHAYDQALSSRLTQGILPNVKEICKDLERVKKEKALLQQQTSIIDFYGLALSHTLIKPLTPHHATCTLSQLSKCFDYTKHPIPLFTAAARLDNETYSWFTCTPERITSQHNNHSIPLWSLGRSFQHGEPHNRMPEPSLGYMLGIFGSSFSLSLRDVIEKAPDYVGSWATGWLTQGMRSHIENAAWANKKISASSLPNFLYKLPDTPGSDKEFLTLVDGGYKNNIPLEPLLSHHKGALDLIIILDNRRNLSHRITGWHDAVATLQSAGYEIPHLSDKQITTQTCTYAPATKSGMPSLIYLTLSPDETYPVKGFDITKDRRYITPNFYYSKRDYKELSDFTAHAIRQRRDLFVKALTESAQL